MTISSPVLVSRATREFERRFGAPPTHIAWAPGRVNLIGDHTDYSEGFVLPMAVNFGTCIAFRPRDDSRVVVHALDLNDTADFDTELLVFRERGWAEYIRGIAWVLTQSGSSLPLRGWEGVVTGDLPIGAGLSSSAALEMAALRAFTAAAAIKWQPVEMARLAQRAESEWVGLECGIMDQFISARGVAGNAVLIDCRTLEVKPIPIPPTARIVVLDTGVRRQLVDSAYNERRKQVEGSASLLGVRSLRDVDATRLTRDATMLSPKTFHRARHVVTENARTVAAAKALARGDLAEMGKLMIASHESLRDDFEVSCEELDIMVAFAATHPACYGARMTGAGFGGCAVALVRAASVDAFVAEVPLRYEAETNLRAAAYQCSAAAGAGLIPTS